MNKALGLAAVLVLAGMFLAITAAGVLAENAYNNRRKLGK